jgi:hypothetical protein
MPSMTNPTATFAAPQELTPAEAAAVFGGRRLQQKVTRKAVVRLARLKNGVYQVKFREQGKNTKQTRSASSFSGASSFRI